MSDLADGEQTEVQGSARKPYVLKNTGGVYSCSCPAWRNQSVPIETRTCKHLRKLRGDASETERLGHPIQRVVRSGGSKERKDGPPVLLAHRWEDDVDIDGWWMSEKLDGVRAYWDGKMFLSRNGNEYMAPDWFVEGLPEEPLDGELWQGRRQFQSTVSIVRRQDRSKHWEKIKYVVFDAPAHKGIFEARQKYLQKLFETSAIPHAELLEQKPCDDVEALQAELKEVEALGGEGLMLRQPGSKYEKGRSVTLLKVKTFHDADARVVGHVAGAGRHKGRLGALEAELPDGTLFNIGTGFSDAEREAPPALGSVVTFRYQELSKDGVPRFPIYVAQRHDLDWQQATESAVEQVAGKSTTSKKVAPRKTNEAPTTPRKFEMASKFWEVWQEGPDVTVRFGKLGTDGQTRVKSFATEALAVAHMHKQIDEKTKKGYKERRESVATDIPE